MNTDQLARLSVAMIGGLLLTATVAVAQSGAGSTAAGSQEKDPPSAVGGASRTAGDETTRGRRRDKATGAGSAVGGESGPRAGDSVAIRKIALERSKYVKRQAKIEGLRR